MTENKATLRVESLMIQLRSYQDQIKKAQQELVGMELAKNATHMDLSRSYTESFLQKALVEHQRYLGNLRPSRIIQPLMIGCVI